MPARSTTEAERKGFPLRLRPEVHEALRRWAEDDLRSLNAQIEFLLVRALERAGRAPRRDAGAPAPAAPTSGDGGKPA
jgi:hypothetical protein